MDQPKPMETPERPNFTSKKKPPNEDTLFQQALSKRKIQLALSKTPSQQTVSKTPFQQTVSKTPSQKTVSKTTLQLALSKITLQQTVSKTPFQQTVSKTPLQQAVPNLRNFKSECQQRVSSRFAQERANKSNHEPLNNMILARLGTIVKSNKPVAAPTPSFAPASSISVSASASASSAVAGAGAAATVSKLPIPRPHLIQDTRIGANNKIGPIATTTKAPLSVSQYTHPTPSSNKSANQVLRAQSESSIKYQVKVNDKVYKVLRKIGSGGSAKVYEGYEPTTYQSVAIKIINVANADPRTRESYFNEQSILTQMKDSKHVVKIYNSEFKSECQELIIVMEKGDADLSHVLDSQSNVQPGMIDGIFVKFYWRGMLLAVNEIHQHGIVHADLKPVNFILVRNQIKLIDFGIASTLEPEGTSVIKDFQIGTINYMAPEALRNRAMDASFVHQQDENNKPNSKKTVIKYNSKADIWSLGCILYNFVYGRPPFDKYPDILSKLQAITNPRHAIDFPAINNAQLLDCMKLCLRFHPDDRPTAAELLNHGYLKDDIVMIGRNP